MNSNCSFNTAKVRSPIPALAAHTNNARRRRVL